MSSNQESSVNASRTVRLLALLFGTQAKRLGASMEHLFNHLSVQNFVVAPLPTTEMTAVANKERAQL
jgi:hypothetical protein